ncbi:hypothetical protein N2152v2_009972 [Parachlorella kessleri]
MARPLSHPTWSSQRSGDAGPCRTLQPALNAYRRNWFCGTTTTSSSRGGSNPIFHSRLGGVSVAVAAAQNQPTRSDSSSTAQPCPLHACLLRYGFQDLAAVSAPKHLALSQEAVSSNVEPKLAALAAEALSHKQVWLVFKAHNSLVWCNYADTFQLNLHLLRDIAAHMKYRPHPKAPQLTAVGKVLAGSPGAVAQYLTRDPRKVQQLLRCLESDLGIGLEQLATCSSLCECLRMSASTAQAVIALPLGKKVPVQQVARMALAAPNLFGRSTTILAAKLAALEEVVDLDAAAALQLASLLYDIKARLPPLLRFLDGYMGVEGAGRRLVRAQPVLGTISAATAEGNIGSLAARGYSQQEIQRIINSLPGFLTHDLDSPLQQQKLDWIERMSPWTLDDFLSVPVYFTYSTRRLAARLALLRECGLQFSPTPRDLAVPSNASFMALVGERLVKQGAKLPCASWAEWEEAWLGTEEGREWGFPPLK